MWLSRSKLIEVRNQAVKHSLISKLIRDRKIYPIHLPDLYEELGRQIMFMTDHNIALTDLRSLLLGAHLQLPVLVPDEELVERISKEIGTRTIQSFEVHADWLSMRRILNIYREVSFRSGKRLPKQLENGCSFLEVIEEIKGDFEKAISSAGKSAREIIEGRDNPGTLQFRYIIWNIAPYIRDYFEEKIVQPKVIRHICERGVFLAAKPLEIVESEELDTNTENYDIRGG